MTVLVALQYSCKAITFIAVVSMSIALLAQSPDAPLARATDIDFSVEYSTGKLMLGDILFARSTLRNKADHAVKISRVNLLDIQAKSSVAQELVYSGDYGSSGYWWLELAPGSEVSSTHVLDMFGNDRKEDGEFSPFDTTLNGQSVVLQAYRSIAESHELDGQDYRDFQPEHKQEIQFGKPIIDKDEFDRAVAAELKREDLKPLKFRLIARQTSHLFTLSRGRYNTDPRTTAAMFHVLSKKLPKESSTRRAATIFLQADQFINADVESEGQAISSLISLLSEGVPMEQNYWRRILLEQFSLNEIGFADRRIIPKEKYDRIVKRFDESGLRGLNTRTGYPDGDD